MFFSHQAGAELMSPPAATTMELLQVKVVADLLEQSLPKLVQEEVCKIDWDLSGAHWGGCQQTRRWHCLSGIVLWCPWAEEAWGWARVSLSPLLQTGAGLVGMVGSSLLGGSSENAGF